MTWLALAIALLALGIAIYAFLLATDTAAKGEVRSQHSVSEIRIVVDDRRTETEGARAEGARPAPDAVPTPVDAGPSQAGRAS